MDLRRKRALKIQRFCPHLIKAAIDNNLKKGVNKMELFQSVGLLCGIVSLIVLIAYSDNIKMGQ